MKRKDEKYAKGDEDKFYSSVPFEENKHPNIYIDRDPQRYTSDEHWRDAICGEETPK